jgi:phosphatidylglycerol:prolipoprotein diacylglycerol transferase
MFLAIVINLDPNLFQIGPFLITWHGVFSVLGILAAARLGLWLLSKDKVDVSRGADGVTWMVLLGLLGARALYVWENFRFFSRQLLHIFFITEGGISQWGGLFGAILGAYIWARRARLSFWKVIDAGGPAAMIGLAIGRIGDVINGEHHGTPTHLPWGVEYVNPNTLGQPGEVVHPEVAYEMILTLGLLALLLPFHQRIKARLPDGVPGLVYLGLYGLGRFWLSYYRTDPAIAFGLRQAQLASLLMLVVAGVAIPILIRRARAPKPTEAAVTTESTKPETAAVAPGTEEVTQPAEAAQPPEVVPAADGASQPSRRRRRRRRRASESARAMEPTVPAEASHPEEADVT